MTMSISATMASLRIRASYDTEQRLPYTPHRTYKPKPGLENGVASAKPAVNLLVSSENFEKVAALLRRGDVKKDVAKEKDDTYLGYERWLPSAPKVKKPRSLYNAASLAYLGDCIYELYARRHFLFPPLAIEEYNDRVMAVVRCEAQDALLQKLLQDNVLTETERDVLRWGKNIGGAKTKTVRRAGAAVYNRASSLETMVSVLSAHQWELFIVACMHILSWKYNPTGGKDIHLPMDVVASWIMWGTFGPSDSDMVSSPLRPSTR